MQDKWVWVVTNPEFGWDCIVGTFDRDSLTKEQLQERFTSDEYVFFEQRIQTNLNEYD